MSSAVLWLAVSLAIGQSAYIPSPKVHDARLKIELFAADPDIVTPCGLAVDARGRVLVVESHTHFRPKNYAGPPADRIRLLVDTNADGRADKITNFFEGTTYTMNVAVHPDGSVYVATRNEILRLRDVNDDGVADERTRIAFLETKGNYPHNGLSGFAFDFDGNVCFGLGENLGSPYRLIGADGSIASDLEGGQVYRCDPLGRDIRQVSFGFWNPFHVCLDAFGRLFAVDNDPDSLPPCRLLNIVDSGNYGYRYRNGRKGVHPFTAWNGELPGTLPMVAGTGEAPSGILAYESDQLPADYVGDLLGTSWGDHRIERFHLEPRGASFRAEPTFIVQGDENFRPVGIATAPDGSLLVSDWVLKDYDLHGKGRVWRISSREGVKTNRPSDPREAIHAVHCPLRENAARKLAAGSAADHQYLEELASGDANPRVRTVALWALKSDAITSTLAAGDKDVSVRVAAVNQLFPADVPDALLKDDQPAEVQAAAMRRTRKAEHAALLWKQVASSDAFIAQAARAGLAHLHAVKPDIDLSKLTPVERLAALLILRESRVAGGEKTLPAFLRDPDTAVRFAAIQWVGEERLAEFRGPLVEALSAGPATSRLFGGYLAALERLDGVKRVPSDEWGGEQYIVRAIEDPKTSPEVLRWSLGMLRPDHPLLSIDRLRGYLDGKDRALQLEAVRTLRDSPHAERGALLAAVATSDKYPLPLRAEAVVGLSPDKPADRSLLLDLACGAESTLRAEALRSLRGSQLSDTERNRLAQISGLDAATSEQIDRLLKPAAASQTPSAGSEDLAAWLKKLRGSDGLITGDAEAGARIFHQRQAGACARCHQIAGRGQRIGPELTTTAGVLAEERLVESILRPSKEIAPQFVTWLVVTDSGKPVTGVLVKLLATGEQTYADADGKLTELKAAEVEHRQPQEKSIMPEGLANQMTMQEFRDLIAFLRSQ